MFKHEICLAGGVDVFKCKLCLAEGSRCLNMKNVWQGGGGIYVCQGVQAFTLK